MLGTEVLRVGDERFQVVVRDGDGETRHDVTASTPLVERLGSAYSSPEEFVRACFAFLLEREPKESILREFDVADIPRYFPEFEREIVADEGSTGEGV
jgi:hypothetical protein